MKNNDILAEKIVKLATQGMDEYCTMYTYRQPTPHLP